MFIHLLLFMTMGVSHLLHLDPSTYLEMQVGIPGLGVDCSGFVTTALASSGLRLKYNKSITPHHIRAVSSWLLKEPKRENFLCLVKQQISQQNPLKPGDIIASANHVIIVDEINSLEDPFSIQSIKQVHPVPL